MGSIKPAGVLSTLQELKTTIKTTDIPNDERRKAYDEARAVMLALEDDGDALVRLQWNVSAKTTSFLTDTSQVYESIGLDIADRMGLLAALVSSNEPLTPSQLAEQCKVEPLLTIRIMRLLDTYGAVDVQVEPVRYVANNITRLSTTHRGKLHSRWWTGYFNQYMFRVPDKIEANGFKCLSSGKDTIFNDIVGKPDTDFFHLLTPEEAAAFGKLMTVYNLESHNWLDFYPVQERLIDGAKPGAFFVDVAGSHGHQSVALMEKYPNILGKVIVQDLPDVLKGVLPGPELVVHDFLTPQPIKGARAYYFRNIMHDWNTETNTVILKHIAGAMEPGYSKVLINEWILPDTGASKLMTSLDIVLMTVLGGEERSLARHKEYIEAAGLKIAKIFDVKDGRSQAIIECELA